MTVVPTVYEATRHGTAPKFNAAFAHGCGARIARDGVLVPGAVALWGDPLLVDLLARARMMGVDWYYGDHAYFYRHRYYRITKNALQHSGVDGGLFASAYLDRFDSLGVSILPARVGGDFILVCPPSEALAGRSGFTQALWVQTVTRRLAAATTRPVVIRHKPRVNHSNLPLISALHGAWALVTYTSNTAVDALCAGYPAFCTGPNPTNLFGNIGLTTNSIERPFIPHVDIRRRWAATLAANQWTLAEIAAGHAWEKLQGD